MFKPKNKMLLLAPVAIPLLVMVSSAVARTWPRKNLPISLSEIFPTEKIGEQQAFLNLAQAIQRYPNSRRYIVNWKTATNPINRKYQSNPAPFSEKFISYDSEEKIFVAGFPYNFKSASHPLTLELGNVSKENIIEVSKRNGSYLNLPQYSEQSL